MDIEQLTKSQIVLLTLLVSFVTSIATGIVTVSLMDQAPPAIAQSVSRVIEHTVEKVTPSGQAAAASVVTQQKTVVVKESDQIAQAVEKTDPSIVRISSNADTPVFLGIGIVIESGVIITDSGALGERSEALIELAGGTRVRAFVSARDKGAGLAYLDAATSTVDGKTPQWTPIAISTTNPVLGETVVSLAGRTISRIADGIITALIPGEKESPDVIDTDIAGESILHGSPLIDTDGSLVGVSTDTARASSPTGFLAAAAIMKSIKETRKTEE